MQRCSQQCPFRGLLPWLQPARSRLYSHAAGDSVGGVGGTGAAARVRVGGSVAVADIAENVDARSGGTVIAATETEGADVMVMGWRMPR
jgi:hypothetical protein